MTMLLPRFELHQPATLAEAAALAKIHAGDCDFLSGGTDLLPNYKCGLNAHGHVISLQHIAELKQIGRDSKGAFTIGAGVTLAEIERNTEVPRGLADCAAHVASPLLRASGTLGGNLMLDNRCHFFNQSYFWRRSLGYCLKADGDRCHVVPQINEGGKSVLNNKVCVATHSSDLAPMLIALGAEATFVGPDGKRTIKLNDFYWGDGIARFDRKPGEILSHVTLPPWAFNVRSGWKKLAPRQSIDFSVVGVAAVLELDGDKVKTLRVALGAVDTTPVLFDFSQQEKRREPGHYLFVDAYKNMPEAVGKKLDDALIETIAKHVQTQAQPKLNVPMAPDYRKKMCGVLTRRLLTELRGGGK
ncbi:MAG: FAD binding domain-containing protein [Planctomycetes bacterium]|nr:FAD binding domain-containing protein [Planctomycetota bacterium]MCW8136842.1 FAD binding domain-containing protein [Planctomycetota bacterium]